MPESSAFERLSHIRSQNIFIRSIAVHVIREWLIRSQTALLIHYNGLSAALVKLSALKRHKQINPTVRINGFFVQSDDL